MADNIKVVSETWEIARLKLWDRNPRSIKTERFEELKTRLNRQGQLKPLLVTSDGIVIGGNMRLRAMQALGWSEVWVSVTTAKTDKEIFDLALTDNEEFGYYEQEQVAELALELGLTPLELGTYALQLGTPTTLDILIDRFGPEVEEDEAPEVDETNPPASKLGEVYELGLHRLMCGDSTNAEHIARLLDGEQVSMVFTDPPYGVDYTSRVDWKRRKGWGGIKNDDLQGEELVNFLGLAVSSFVNKVPTYVCCNWQSYGNFEDALGQPNALIVWDKGSIGLGAGYRNQYELVMFFGILDHNSETNVWAIKRDATAGYAHPTQKPIAVASRALKNSSRKGGAVLDQFLGSGSTLIAAERLGRTCYGMELDPKYCDVVRKRYWKCVNGSEEGWQDGTDSSA